MFHGLGEHESLSELISGYELPIIIGKCNKSKWIKSVVRLQWSVFSRSKEKKMNLSETQWVILRKDAPLGECGSRWRMSVLKVNEPNEQCSVTFSLSESITISSVRVIQKYQQGKWDVLLLDNLFWRITAFPFGTAFAYAGNKTRYHP